MLSSQTAKTGAGSDTGRRVFRRVVVVLGLITLLITAPFAVADGGTSAKKPQVPIGLQFGTEGPVAVGSAVTVTLTVTPMISSESVEVSILLSDGLSRLEGDAGWTGPLDKNQSHVLTIRVRPELAASLEIKGLAVITLPGGSKMRRHAVLALDLDPNKSKPTLHERRSPRGDSILEIPAESRPKNK